MAVNYNIKDKFHGSLVIEKIGTLENYSSVSSIVSLYLSMELVETKV